jgi:hypothetical protein
MVFLSYKYFSLTAQNTRWDFDAPFPGPCLVECGKITFGPFLDPHVSMSKWSFLSSSHAAIWSSAIKFNMGFPGFFNNVLSIVVSGQQLPQVY